MRLVGSSKKLSPAARTVTNHEMMGRRSGMRRRTALNFAYGSCRQMSTFGTSTVAVVEFPPVGRLTGQVRV